MMKNIAEMVKIGVIRESSSPYASTVVIVKKKENNQSHLHGLQETEQDDSD